MPSTVVETVMKIGRMRVRTLSASASAREAPLSRRKLSAWWTIRIELLTTVPARITKPIIVITSMSTRGCASWAHATASTPPVMAKGTVIRMTKGSAKESNSAAMSR